MVSTGRTDTLQRVLLLVRHGEENATQLKALRCKDQLLETLHLFGIALFQTRFHTDAHALHDLVRSRIVAIRLAVHHLFRFLEDDAARDGIPFEELLHSCALVLALQWGFHQFVGKADGRIEQRFFGGNAVHQSHFLSGIGEHILARKHHVQCFLDADKSRQSLCATTTGQQTEFHLGQRKHRLRTVGCHAGSAGQGYLQSSTHTRTVYGCYYGFFAFLQTLQYGMALFGNRLPVAFFLHIGECFDVGSSNEILLATDHHSGLHFGILFQFIHQRVEHADHVRPDLVHLAVLLVHPDDGDAVAVFYFEVFVSHDNVDVRRGIIDG
jgi:hypothetical protein